MPAHNHTVTVSSPAVEFTLPELDLRSLARRAALPLALAAVAIVAVLLAASHVHTLSDELRRVISVSPGWALVAVALECASIAGYVALLSLVAGSASPRIRMREGAQITLAGAAATRLLPTAGVGGLALALWALRQAGLRSRAATRTLLVFLVLLYSVFLAAIVLAGAALALGLVANHGPVELSAIPAAVAAVAIALALVLGSRAGAAPTGSGETAHSPAPSRVPLVGRLANGAELAGGAVREALALVRTGDVRLLGAIAYWGLDAAVLWAMLHAFGAHVAVPAVVLAYFVGQVANTLPIPGSVSGGIAGVLIAFGVSPALALPAVLAYRTVAVWLPTPVAIVQVPALRATIARWQRESAAPLASVAS